MTNTTKTQIDIVLNEIEELRAGLDAESRRAQKLVENKQYGQVIKEGGRSKKSVLRIEELEVVLKWLKTA